MRGHQTVRKALAILRAEDPDTGITEHCLRRLCKDGRVKSFCTGNKVMVNMKSLDEFLENGDILKY